jgi:hypothetical protein
MESRNLTEEIQVIELLKERFYIENKIDAEILLYDIRFVRNYFDDISGNLLIKLEKFIAMEKKKEVVTYLFPKNLWQLIKEFYFPNFLKRLCKPTKFIEMNINIDLDVKYLDIPVYLQDKKPVIRIKNLDSEKLFYTRKMINGLATD